MVSSTTNTLEFSLCKQLQFCFDHQPKCCFPHGVPLARQLQDDRLWNTECSALNYFKFSKEIDFSICINHIRKYLINDIIYFILREEWNEGNIILLMEVKSDIMALNTVEIKLKYSALYPCHFNCDNLSKMVMPDPY